MAVVSACIHNLKNAYRPLMPTFNDHHQLGIKSTPRLCVPELLVINIDGLLSASFGSGIHFLI